MRTFVRSLLVVAALAVTVSPLIINSQTTTPVKRLSAEKIFEGTALLPVGRDVCHVIDPIAKKSNINQTLVLLNDVYYTIFTLDLATSPGITTRTGFITYAKEEGDGNVTLVFLVDANVDGIVDFATTTTTKKGKPLPSFRSMPTVDFLPGRENYSSFPSDRRDEIRKECQKKYDQVLGILSNYICDQAKEWL